MGGLAVHALTRAPMKPSRSPLQHSHQDEQYACRVQVRKQQQSAG